MIARIFTVIMLLTVTLYTNADANTKAVQCAKLGINGCQPAVNQTQNKSTATTTQTVSDDMYYCPMPTSLTKKQQIWRVPGYWRSYSPSFVSQVTRFQGAQWVGVKYGKVFCFYQGAALSGGIGFPIVIEQTHVSLVPKPQSGMWTSNKQSQADCPSDNVADCAFEVDQPKKQQDPYKQIDFYKDQKNPGF